MFAILSIVLTKTENFLYIVDVDFDLLLLLTAAFFTEEPAFPTIAHLLKLIIFFAACFLWVCAYFQLVACDFGVMS